MKNKKISSAATGTFIFWLVFAAYAFSYLGRNTFSACLKIMGEQGLFAPGFDGYISAVYLVLYGSGQLINGIIVTKVSPKIMGAVGLAGSGIANLLMTVANNQYLYLVLWGLNGFCCAMMWPSVIAVFSSWLNRAEREKAAPNISPSIPIGSIGCYLISFFMLKSASAENWKHVFILSGCLLVFGSLCWVIAVRVMNGAIDKKIRETRELELAGNTAASADRKTVRFTPMTVITSGLIIMVVASLFNGSLKEAVISYVPTYISESFGYPSDTASLISTLLPIFAVAGPYFGIFIKKRVHDNECATIGVLMGVSALCNLVIFLTGSRIAVLSVVMIAVSTACMWGVNNMLMTFTPFHFNKMGASTIVSGILNGTVFIGSAVFTVLYRNVANASGWNTTVLIWTVCGVICCACCLAFAGMWLRKRPE